MSTITCPCGHTRPAPVTSRCPKCEPTVVTGRAYRPDYDDPREWWPRDLP